MVLCKLLVVPSMLIIKFLSLLFRCVGIAPSESPTDKFIYLAMIGGLASQYHFHMGTVTRRDEDSLALVLFTVGSWCGFLGIFFFLTYNLFYQESYQTILRDLEDTEDELRVICASPRPTLIMQIFLSSFISFKLLLVVAVGVFTKSSIFFIISDLLINTINTCAMVQHMVLVSILHSMFSALNDQLKRLSAAADDTPVDVMSFQLESVFRIHTSLHLTVFYVNRHFSIFNLITTSIRLFFTILFMYLCMNTIAQGKEQINVTGFIIFIFEIVFWFVMQCVICHACAKDANYTVLLAHYLLQSHTPHRLWKEVGDFSSLYIDNKVKFEVAGVFILNRPLITKFSVLALSYLIVALQLKDAHVFGDDNNTLPAFSNETDFDNATEDTHLSF